MKQFSNLRPSSNSEGTGKIPRGQRGCGVRLTTHRHHLVLKLGMVGVKTLLPLYTFLGYMGIILIFLY
jgi:hypothetical protein